jgi:NADPH-dependent 2,4-dienoyl-CoA reductase/sulfur reductase-like enzyme
VSDVLVVGGGPAGLAAARSALARGASVTLVDAGLRLGGQLLRQPVVDPGDPARPGPPVGPSLPRRFHGLAGHPRLEVITGRSVWSIGRELGGTSSAAGGAGAPTLLARLEGQLVCRARAVVLAPGASELLLPFDGWELPGVISAGAAQALLKAQHQLVGRRVVVAGSGPFLWTVAAALARAGATVAAVAEALAFSRLARLAPALALRPARLVEAARYGDTLLRRRVPVLFGHAVVRCEGDGCEGDGAVTRAVLARVGPGWRAVRGTEQVVAADAVCVSFGFVPRLELARQLGVAERRGVHHPGVAALCDEAMGTAVPGVFVAGELTGVAGGEVAEAEGSLAGDSAAGYCGFPPCDSPVATGAARRRLGRARRFAARLDRVYRPGGGLAWAADATVVCRCEDVTAGALRSAIATGARSVRELRSLTRCGMGYCQGRTCGPILQLALRQAAGVHFERSGDLHRRPVAVPVPLGEVGAGD